MDVPPILVTPPAPQPAPTGKPKRHGCLITWLIIMLLSDCLAILGKILGPALDGFVQQAVNQPNSLLHGVSVPTPAPEWVNLALIALSVIDIVAVIFIFNWKRWAFYASVAVSVSMMVVTILGGTSIPNAVLYLVCPILLYVTLTMGGENCGWKRLR